MFIDMNASKVFTGTVVLLAFWCIVGHCKQERIKWHRMLTRHDFGYSETDFVKRFELNRWEALRPITSRRRAGGTEIVKYQQTYKGIPLYGTVVVAEKRNDKYTGWARGHVIRNVERDLRGGERPRITRRWALRQCKKSNGHVMLKRVENSVVALTIQFRQFQRQHTSAEDRHELRKRRKGRSQLIFVVKYFYGDARRASRPVCVVDAISGRVIETWDGLLNKRPDLPKKIDSVGGNLFTGQYSYSKNYGRYLQLDVLTNGSYCSLETAYVKTFHYNNKYRAEDKPTAPYTFKCSSGIVDSVNDGYSPLSDAHHFAHQTRLAYMQYLDEEVLPTPFDVYVHYRKNYENAFWNGQAVFFGDGNATGCCYPLTTLHIVAHELAHGYTDLSCSLETHNEGWGIHEAFSDISALAVEFFTNNQQLDPVTFTIGYDSYRWTHGHLVRGMCNYTVNTPQDMIYHYDQYVAGMNGHVSSGIYSKAFCILAKTEGWGVIKAFKLFGIANKLFWYEWMDFNQGVCEMEAAAEMLDYNVADVKSAFNAVGCFCPP